MKFYISGYMLLKLHDLRTLSPENAFAITCYESRITTVNEACIGVLGIQDICHFTSRDIGYYPFYFQGYGILC